jgi:hypothetical protein
VGAPFLRVFCEGRESELLAPSQFSPKLCNPAILEIAFFVSGLTTFQAVEMKKME